MIDTLTGVSESKAQATGNILDLIQSWKDTAQSLTYGDQTGININIRKI